MSIIYLIYRSNLQCPSIAGWINMQGDILFNSCHKAQSNVDHIPDIWK